MREAFTFLYSRVLLEILLVTGVIALVTGRIRRRLRIRPDQNSRAPLMWLVNMTADARLHRRLRKLAARARAAAQGGRRHRRRGSTPAQRLAVDIGDEIVTLDERLIDSRQLDLEDQSRVVAELRADADRLASLTDRVAALIEREATDPSVGVTVDPIGAIAARVDDLEQATAARSDGVIDTSGAATTPAGLETAAAESAS